MRKILSAFVLGLIAATASAAEPVRIDDGSVQVELPARTIVMLSEVK